MNAFVPSSGRRGFARLVAGITLTLAALGAAAPAAQAQDVVRIVVPFAPGGPVDQIARLIQPALARELGRNVVVENRAGAGGTIGAQAVARAGKDGNTMLLASAAFVLSSGTMASVPYDPRADFAPVAMIGDVQTILVARKTLDVDGIEGVVSKGRAGEQLRFGSSGMGSSMHIAGEMLSRVAGGKFVHVPYKGAAPAIVDLIGHQIDLVEADLPVLLPYVRDGRVKPIAVFDTKRSPLLPDVPSTGEKGLATLTISNWYGVLAPAGTPTPVLATLEKAWLAAIRDPATAAKLAEAGLGGPQPAEAFGKHLAAQFDRWVPFVREAGIRAQ